MVFYSLIRIFAPVMVQQIEIILNPKRRGFHLVTSEIVSKLPNCKQIAETAEDGYREYLHEAHQLRTEYQRELRPRCPSGYGNHLQPSGSREFVVTIIGE